MESALELDGSEMMGRNIVAQQTKNKTPSNYGRQNRDNSYNNNNNQSGDKLFSKFKDQTKGEESCNVIVRNMKYDVDE